MSQLLPGGHTSLDASPIEKIYFVIEGELTIETSDGETTLSRSDSCRIAPHEKACLEKQDGQDRDGAARHALGADEIVKQ